MYVMFSREIFLKKCIIVIVAPLLYKCQSEGDQKMYLSLMQLRLKHVLSFSTCLVNFCQKTQLLICSYILNKLLKVRFVIKQLVVSHQYASSRVRK